VIYGEALIARAQVGLSITNSGSRSLGPFCDPTPEGIVKNKGTGLRNPSQALTHEEPIGMVLYSPRILFCISPG